MLLETSPGVKVTVQERDGSQDIHISFFSNTVQRYHGAEVFFWRVVEVIFTKNGMKVFANTDTETIPGGSLSWEQIDFIRSIVAKGEE